MSAAIASERTALANVEKRSREVSGRLEALGRTEADLRRLLANMQSAEEAVRRVDDLSRQLAAMQDTASRQVAELNDLSVREQHLRRQLALASDKLAKLTAQQEAKRAEFADRLAVLRRDYSGLSDERASLNAKMDDTDRLIKDMEGKV
jgi:kinetochore protein Nuf2